MHTNTIGWIGLGRMGNPMSRQLIKAGYDVTVYNRSKEKEEALTILGAKAVSSPALLMQQADVIMIMVSDDLAIWEVFTGKEGLLSIRTTGKTIINMSTVSPTISKEMAYLCSQQGNYYLDAPVSGSVKQAEDGQLVIMVGGEKTIFEKAKPIFEHLGKTVTRMGDTGAGNTSKLAI